MKNLYRCRWNRKLFGVFGGLGQLFRIDPNILRLIAIFLIIPLGVVILPVIYLIFTVLLPEGPRCFVQPTYKRLYKLDQGKVIFGVCSGLAQFLKINVLFVRLGMIILCTLTGFFPIIITYIAAQFLFPLKPYSNNTH